MAALRPLSPELAKVARKELNEDPKRLREDLDHLRDWISKQPHLRARTDEQFLVAFLRGCKFSLERTKEKIDAYYTMRSAAPEFFAGREPMMPEVQRLLEKRALLPLGVDFEGRRVLLLRVGLVDGTESRVVDAMRLTLMLIETQLRDDDASVVQGQMIVIDMEGTSLAIATQLTPVMVKKCVVCFEDSLPIRFKGVHFFNLAPMMARIINLFRSFMKPKMRARMMVHPDVKSLHQKVPADVLPQEYGGKAGSAAQIADKWKARLEADRDYFLDDNKYGTEEKRRPGAPKTQETLFGVAGSFRNLDVD